MPTPKPTPPLALGLALAVISTSDAPLLLLDGDLAILVASRSFCRAFQCDPATVAGQPMAAGFAPAGDGRRLRRGRGL